MAYTGRITGRQRLLAGSSALLAAFAISVYAAIVFDRQYMRAKAGELLRQGHERVLERIASDAEAEGFCGSRHGRTPGRPGQGGPSSRGQGSRPRFPSRV